MMGWSVYDSGRDSYEYIWQGSANQSNSSNYEPGYEHAFLKKTTFDLELE